MIVIAGPPGSGKTSRFPLSSFGIDWFNADNRAAELNRGSFRKISKQIRTQVNSEFEKWIQSHILMGQSFAMETTLRSPITFEQSRLARDHGFWTAMHYVSAGSVEESVRRIMERSYRGGHSASERLVRAIYNASNRSLLTALDFGQSGIEALRIYDNSKIGGRIRQVLSFRRGAPRWIAAEIPSWLESLLEGSEFEISRLRRALK